MGDGASLVYLFSLPLTPCYGQEPTFSWQLPKNQPIEKHSLASEGITLHARGWADCSLQGVRAGSGPLRRRPLSVLPLTPCPSRSGFLVLFPNPSSIQGALSGSGIWTSSNRLGCSSGSHCARKYNRKPIFHSATIETNSNSSHLIAISTGAAPEVWGRREHRACESN